MTHPTRQHVAQMNDALPQHRRKRSHVQLTAVSQMLHDRPGICTPPEHAADFLVMTTTKQQHMPADMQDTALKMLTSFPGQRIPDACLEPAANAFEAC